MSLRPTIHGLLARSGDYEPLRAFSQGGCYWDKAPQQLIRESALAEFLPPVELEKDDEGKYGRFHLDRAGRELLSRSKPLGPRRVPPDQLGRLKQAVEDFRNQSRDPAAQPQNRELIERFRLPDLKLEPELYRLVGPWWNHRLQILWGCERRRDSSLAPSAAVQKLEEDPFYNLRRLLAALILLLLLFLPAWWLSRNWDQVQSWLAQRARPQTVASGNGASAIPVENASTNAASLEAQAEKAQAEADKARADADLARQKANQTKADAAATKKQADDAQAAADKAEQIAKDARAAADKAQARAVAARNSPGQNTALPKGSPSPSVLPAATNPQAQPVAPKSSPTGGIPTLAPVTPPTGLPANNPLLPGAGSLQPSTTGAPTTTGPSAPPVSQIPSTLPCQIVLCEQAQPATDGTMAVTLEVRPIREGAPAVPVQAWYYDGKTVTSKSRLEANLKAGDHLIKAAIFDPSGNRAEVQGVLTVELGQVITTPGKVSLRPKP